MARKVRKENKQDSYIDMYDLLKNTVIKLDPKDRFCVLLMDESAVQPKNVPKSRLVEGEVYPTHVINFMLRGIYGQWKLPISNIFWSRQGAESGGVLGDTIKKIINNVARSGLTVIASVSDHSKINIAAVDYLTKNNIPFGCYIVGFNRVFHIYDPCRLIKSVRNHLLKNDLVFEMNGQKKVASWKHITSMYAIDVDRGKDIRLPKLSLLHVCPLMIDKLTTRYCTQVFSESVAMEMKRTVEINQLDKSALDTADLLLFFDQLFDSCNGLQPYAFHPKKYRCAIGVGNPHFEFWEQAEKILDSMRYILPNSDKVYRPDCLDKWTNSLTGMKNVTKVLKKYKIKFVPSRNFNLDALMNMMQILRVVNNDPARVYCEKTEGEILDQNILRIVLEEDEGYFEIV